MVRQTFEEQLGALTSRDEDATTALVEEYAKDLAAVHESALRYIVSGGTYALRGHSLIGQLGETAVAALVSAVEAEPRAPDVLLMTAMVRGVLFAETMVVERLKRALADPRIVPQPAGMSPQEQKPPPYRVCDEAYVGLRRLLCPESVLQNLQESRHFLGLPDASKDSEIRAWSESGAFTRFLDEVAIEGE